jgi:Zn-dependent protease with chaperone function
MPMLVSQSKVFLLAVAGCAAALLLGVESRLLVQDGHWLIPCVLLLAFAFCVAFLKERWIHSLLTQGVPVRIRQGDGVTRSVRIQPRPADSDTAQAIRERAAELGYRGELAVYELPGTHSIVNAFAFGRGAQHGVVLTFGARALRYIDPPGFEFLLDHELGHVIAQDTGMFASVRAIIKLLPVFLPLKIAVLLLFDPSQLATRIAELLPTNTRVTFFMGNGVTWSEVERVTVSPIVAFTLIPAIWVLWWGLANVLYRTMVRRRELWADAFANAQRGWDVSNTREVLSRLLQTSVPLRTPSLPFFGDSWHPPASTRLESLSDPKRHGSRFGSVVAAMVVTLVVLRWTFGASGLKVDDGLPGEVTFVLGVIFALIVGYFVGGIVHSARTLAVSAREQRRLLLRYGMSIVGIVIFLSAILVSSSLLMPAIPQEPLTTVDDIAREFQGVERFESILGALGLPVIAITFLITSARAISNSSSFGIVTILLPTLVSLLLLMFVGNEFVAPLVDDFRASTISRADRLVSRNASADMRPGDSFSGLTTLVVNKMHLRREPYRPLLAPFLFAEAPFDSTSSLEQWKKQHDVSLFRPSIRMYLDQQHDSRLAQEQARLIPFKKELDALIVAYNAAHPRQDTHSKALVERAKAALAASDRSEAKRLLDRALTDDAFNAEASYLRGQIFFYMGDWVSAIADFNASIYGGVSIDASAARIAQARIKNHQRDLAMEELQKYAPSNTWPEATETLAWILSTNPHAQPGDTQRAVEIATSLASSRRDTRAFATLAIAQASVADLRIAQTSIREACVRSADSSESVWCNEIRDHLDRNQPWRPSVPPW